ILDLNSTLGHQHLKFDKQARKIMKLADCKISLNAIAKGYGADLVAEYLHTQNICNFMVEVAGEVVTSGKNGNDANWRLAIEKPITDISSHQQVLIISDMAIATSGDYRKYFEINNKRFSHVLDPKTQKPIMHKLASVTVLDKSSARADALATAMLVMGDKKAYEFAEKHSLPVYLIIKKDSDFEVKHTDEMSKYLLSD
ncbi:MAG: FAD:protein FMN transferase, partial [Rhizobiales bacterium]|nr:FAD:protein FMN transferase [Hyphomicrobiales bacterium]